MNTLVSIPYEPRTYRNFKHDDRFKIFRVAIETSDLYIRALKPLASQAENFIRDAREQVEAAIFRRPEFVKTLVPITEDEHDGPVPFQMIRAAKAANVGPMAAVAGAIAEYVGRGLLELSEEIIVENGGDIFLKVHNPTVIGLFAGNSSFSRKIGLRIDSTALSLGVCTSSATVGPSLSLGKADAATIISRDTALADAMATALGNRIQGQRDLKKSVEWALEVPGVLGALAILGDTIAAKGDIELVPLLEHSIPD